MRTSKQRWAQERCFQAYGSLVGIETRIRQISHMHSTLPEEYEKLQVIAADIGAIRSMWLDEKIKERSKKLYRERI